MERFVYGPMINENPPADMMDSRLRGNDKQKTRITITNKKTAMNTQILPTINVATAEKARKKIEIIGSIAPWIQIDVNDNSLTAISNWHEAKDVRRWNIKPNIELHLMIADPWRVIKKWTTVKKFKRASWQMEAPVDHAKLIRACHRLGLEVGLALAPETPVAALVPFLQTLDAVLIVGVHPGPSGQKLIRSTLKKISEVRRLAPRLPITWDGGVTEKNMRRLSALGVRRLTMASAIFNHDDPAQALRNLQRQLT